MNQKPTSETLGAKCDGMIGILVPGYTHRTLVEEHLARHNEERLQNLPIKSSKNDDNATEQRPLTRKFNNSKVQIYRDTSYKSGSRHQKAAKRMVNQHTAANMNTGMTGKATDEVHTKIEKKKHTSKTVT